LAAEEYDDEEVAQAVPFVLLVRFFGCGAIITASVAYRE
jgi:hypothetical protein